LKFLIDENLSPDVARLARDYGFVESAHVNHRGMRGWPDRAIARAAIKDSWTLVTSNARHFRPQKGSTSSAPCFAGVVLHAGLVCLNLPGGTYRADHVRYMEAALAEIANTPEITNEVVEVSPDPDAAGKVVIDRYRFP